jgi:7-cyano-7-deazaguanine synthase
MDRDGLRLSNGAVVLLSGGVDSVTLLHYVRKRLQCPRILALSFLYGQKHSRELQMARWQAQAAGVAEHQVIDMSFYGALTEGGSALTGTTVALPDLADIPAAHRHQPPTYVPNRNMIFLSLAAAWAEARGVPDVFYGAQQQDEYGYWDCTVDFVAKMNDLFALNRNQPVRLHAPFVRMRKAEVVEIGLALGVDYTHTWSCYRGGEEPCGRCPSCVERKAAFDGCSTPGATR